MVKSESCQVIKHSNHHGSKVISDPQRHATDRLLSICSVRVALIETHFCLLADRELVEPGPDGLELVFEVHGGECSKK